MDKADRLREVLINLMIENAQIRASVGPVLHSAHLNLDELPRRFDEALQELNDALVHGRRSAVVVDAGFKQAVIDTLIRRMELAGRVLVG